MSDTPYGPLDLAPIITLLQRDVPAAALPYWEALRACVWEIEILREQRAAEVRLAKQLAALITGAGLDKRPEGKR